MMIYSTQNFIGGNMIYKSLAKKAGRRRASMEREANPDPLSGPARALVIYNFKHSHIEHILYHLMIYST